MPETVNPETHHETSDVNVRALFMFVVIFVVFAVLTHISLWIMFKQFAKIARHSTTPALTEMARPANASIPQTPRLQPFPNEERKGEVMPPNTQTPEVDMVRMRAAENHALDNPGWIDQQHGVVRIPIELAKQLAVQRLSAGAHP